MQNVNVVLSGKVKDTTHFTSFGFILCFLIYSSLFVYSISHVCFLSLSLFSSLSSCSFFQFLLCSASSIIIVLPHFHSLYLTLSSNGKISPPKSLHFTHLQQFNSTIMSLFTSFLLLLLLLMRRKKNFFCFGANSSHFSIDVGARGQQHHQRQQ